jgi:single-stranded DNA-binding protein
MTIFRLAFAGEIKRIEFRTVGNDQLAEFSICKKNKTKDGEEDSFTWATISLWKPASFQLPKLVKGAFVAGSGEFHLRSYVDKEGLKRQSAECRCTSYDVEVAGPAESKTATEHLPPKTAPARAPMTSQPTGGGIVDEVPFLAHDAWSWG